MNYCLDNNCTLDHCLWGKDGTKKKHLKDCKQNHCYNNCNRHLGLDQRGFVISWYCDDHKPRQVDTSWNARFEKLKKNAPKADPVEIKLQQAFDTTNALVPVSYKD